MPKTDHSILSPLTALSPLDGRYRQDILPLANDFSEYGLIKTRLEVEILWLLTLSKNGIIRTLTDDEKHSLTNIATHFTVENAEIVKTLEDTTRHDVKALELFIRERIKETSLTDTVEFIHFGLTSEDVNNLAYRLILTRATRQTLLPVIDGLIDDVMTKAKVYKKLPMLARTHGQPGIPTTLGKELAVFAIRMNREARLLEHIKLTGKITGAVGNYTALTTSYPTKEWIEITKEFIESLGFIPNIFTTQINPYEDVIALLQTYQRLNGIVLDFDQDMWRYISDGWFIQEVKAQEVGSSTMPQKVNPIRFENSEGNVGIANTLIDQFTRKLPVSRLQRDLSDSTVIRTIGSSLGYSLIAYSATRNGLQRVKAHEAEINAALQKDWAILGEGVQTILRREGVPDAYGLIKSMTRGEHMDEKVYVSWIQSLPIADDIKKYLLSLRIETYIGLAPRIVDEALDEIHASRTQ